MENADMKASMKDMGNRHARNTGKLSSKHCLPASISSGRKRTLSRLRKVLAVYNIIRDKKIADVEMTGMWENTLAK